MSDGGPPAPQHATQGPVPTTKPRVRPPPSPRLGPFLAALGLTVVAVTTTHPAPLLVLLAATAVLAPRPRWPILLLAAGGLVMNGLFSWHGATELWRAPFTLDILGRPRLTAEALLSGLTTGLQIGVAGFALLWGLQATPPHAVAGLLPGKAVRIATLLGLRAVPDLRQDAAAMQHALAVRGIDGRGRGAGQVLVPLVARSLDRASDALEGMHMRGMDGPPRPALPVRVGAVGWTAIAAAITWSAVAGLGSGPKADFFPVLDLSGLAAWQTWTPLLALAPLLFLDRPATPLPGAAPAAVPGDPQ